MKNMREDFGKRLARIVGQKRVNDLKQQASVSAQIIKARNEIKWSQQNLADAIGVAKSTIGRIEAGISNPSYITLLKISQALDTQFIIDGTEQEENNEGLIRV
jgi:transcriptional regulator with XRE-family HTH domain